MEEEEVAFFDVSDEVICIVFKGRNAVHLIDQQNEKLQEICQIRSFPNEETIQQVAFDKSSDLLVIGFKSGLIGIYMQVTQSALPVGNVPELLPQFFDVLNTCIITEIVIAATSVFVGTNLGIVSKLDVDKNSQVASITRILELNAPIFQMDWSPALGILLASSRVKTVICNTRLKTFNEIGKPSWRQRGKFGGCIISHRGEIIVSRPGRKLSRTRLDGHVISTCFFHSNSDNLLNMLNTMNEEVVTHEKKADNFTKMFVLSINTSSSVVMDILVSYCPTALFLLRSTAKGITLEKTLKMPIKMVRVQHQQAYVLTTRGELVAISARISKKGGLVLSEKKLKGFKIHSPQPQMEEANDGKQPPITPPTSSHSSLLGRFDFNEDNLDLESFFNLPGDMTSQATSLLSEKISLKAKKLIQLSKSRLQTALEDLSDSHASPTDSEDDNDSTKMLTLAQEIVDSEELVCWWRDFIMLIQPGLPDEMDENGQTLCKKAAFKILSLHVDPRVILENHRLFNQMELQNLFEVHAAGMDFDLFSAFLQSFLAGEKKSNRVTLPDIFDAFKYYSEVYSSGYLPNRLMLFSYLSIAFEQDQDFGLDILANFGFIFTLKELLFAAASLEFTLQRSKRHELASFEEFLDEMLQPDDEFKAAQILAGKLRLQKALCISFERKWILQQEDLFKQDNLSSKEKTFPRLLFIKMFSKIKATTSHECLIQLGFGLMNTSCTSLEEKLMFCKESQFWPGYKMLISDALNEEERMEELSFVLTLDESEKCLEPYFHQAANQNGDSYFCQMITTYLDTPSPAVSFEHVAFQIMNRVGGNATKNLLMKVAPKLPNGILSRRFYNLLIQQCLHEVLKHSNELQEEVSISKSFQA